jgi:hypothetical protein
MNKCISESNQYCPYDAPASHACMIVNVSYSRLDSTHFGERDTQLPLVVALVSSRVDNSTLSWNSRHEV